MRFYVVRKDPEVGDRIISKESNYRKAILKFYELKESDPDGIYSIIPF